jgi:septum formation protein
MARMNSRLLLASASSTRARLLAAAGVEIGVDPAEIDENRLKQAFRAEARTAADCAVALAETKARHVASRCDGALVIGADQILVCGDRWFDKPSNLGETRTQLLALRGRSHELVTAACVVRAQSRLWHTVSQPKLKMRDFSNDFLNDYVAAEGAVLLGSVGAYRLEGRGVQLFEQIDGDQFAILGLPLLELLGFLRDYGAIPS